MAHGKRVKKKSKARTYSQRQRKYLAQNGKKRTRGVDIGPDW